MTATHNKMNIARAHKIASELEAEGYSAEDSTTILSMALGIFMEGKGGHRNLKPLTDSMLRCAQIAFDALRQGRRHEPGNA